MQTGMDYDENETRIEHSTPQELFPWDRLPPELQIDILDMAYRTEHRTKIPAVCKERGKT